MKSAHRYTFLFFFFFKNRIIEIVRAREPNDETFRYKKIPLEYIREENRFEPGRLLSNCTFKVNSGPSSRFHATLTSENTVASVWRCDCARAYRANLGRERPEGVETVTPETRRASFLSLKGAKSTWQKRSRPRYEYEC